jgi:hypothetical protein
MGSVGLVYRNRDGGKLFVSVVFVFWATRPGINERYGNLSAMIEKSRWKSVSWSRHSRLQRCQEAGIKATSVRQSLS